MKVCKVDKCNSSSRSLGLCNKHLARFKRHGHTRKNGRMHGMTGSNIHNLWSSLRQKYVVSEEWNSFLTFYNDVGERPSYDHMIKRIDESLPYSKDNFKWVTKNNK